MKCLTLLLCLLAGFCLDAQSLLQGLVTEQHSGRALAGVTVSAFGGSHDQTDQNGRFQLSFSNKEAGEPVQLLIDDQSGDRLVVNQKEIESLRIPALPTDLIRIVMADQASLEEARLRYYNIVLPHTKRAITLQRDSIMARLKQPMGGRMSSILMVQIASLRTDSASLARQAEELADYLAAIDLDQASKLQRKALKRIEEGAVDEALVLLNSEALEKQYNKALRQLKKAEAAIQDVVQGYRMKAQLLEGSFKNFDAAACWERIAEIRKEQSGNDPKAIAVALEKAGWLYENGGEYRRAQTAFRAAIELRESMPYPDEYYLAVAYGKLGRLMNFKGQYDSAMYFLDKSRQTLEGKGDTLNAELATAYSQIGIVHINRGEYEQGLKVLHKAERIKEKVLPLFDPEKAPVYNNLATLYTDIRETDKALVYHHKALALLRVNYEEPHPNFARVYNNLASLHKTIGDYEKAIEFQSKALETQKKVLWEFHPELGISYSNLAGNLMYTGKLDTAIAYFEKSRDILSVSLDSTHPILAIIYFNIARAQLELGDLEQAIATQRKSLAITAMHYPADHPEMGKTYGGIGVTFQRLGEMDSAKIYLHRSLDIVAKSHQAGKLDHAVQLSLMGDFYLENGDFEEAGHYLSVADTIWQSEKLATHPRRIKHEKVWVRLLAQQKRAEEALGKIRWLMDIGFKDIAWLESEKALDGLRELPEFQAILAKLKAAAD